MVAMVTKGDGTTAVLFHMEQHDGWFYRWRMVGPYPAVYLEWREGRAAAHFIILTPETAFCEIQAEWRKDFSDEWSQVTLLQFTLGTVTLKIESLIDMQLIGFNHLVVSARADDSGISAFEFKSPSGTLDLKAGEPIEVEAVADVPIFANFLTFAEQFFMVQPPLTIRNIGPVRDGYLPYLGPAILEKHVSVAGRHLWASAPTFVS